MNRWHIVGVLVGVSILLVGIPAIITRSLDWPGLWLNLAAEILGMAMTVAIVDWLIERSKLMEEARRLAWATLHEIDHAVWVWQGGRREFHLDELAAVLSLVSDMDPMPVFTQNMMANLGMRAADSLRLQPRVFREQRRLKLALQSLSGLAQIRELGSLMPPTAVQQAMTTALGHLAAVTEQGLHPTSFGVVKQLRDPSAEAQEQRYRGIESGNEPPKSWGATKMGVASGGGGFASDSRGAESGGFGLPSR